MGREVARRQHAVKRRHEPRAAIARGPHGDAWSTLVVRVFQLNGLLTAAGDALAAPAGQSSARWQILAAIEDAPRSVADVARVLGLARQSVQRVADLLEREGLASYGDNPAHLRAKLLQLSPQGRAALAQIGTAQRAWADRIGERLDLRKLQAASATLSEALELLRADETPPRPARTRERAAPAERAAPPRSAGAVSRRKRS